MRAMIVGILMAVLMGGCATELRTTPKTAKNHREYVSPFELETAYEFAGDLMPPDFGPPDKTTLPGDADPNFVACFTNIRVVKGHPPIGPDGIIRFGIHGIDDYVDIAGPEPWGKRFLLGVSKKGGILMVAPLPGAMPLAAMLD